MMKLLNRFLRPLDLGKIMDEVGGTLVTTESHLDSCLKRYHADGNVMLHPYVEIAQMFMNSGMHKKAEDFYSRFLQSTDNQQVHGLYLQNLLLSSYATKQSLLSAHKEWANKYDSTWRRWNWQHKLAKTAMPKIKIGYLCHFFANSIAHNCFLPFLKKHDKNKFEVYCYDDGETPEDIRSYAEHWRDIRGLSDKQVANLIKADQVNILQEMNGFCIINRFNALSYRPAPIQINWYNHTSTTGLPYIDYVMSDVVSIPDSDVSYFAENVYRCKNFNAAVIFDEQKFGAIQENIPFEKNNYITFGYFGGSHKITELSIGTWSRILHAIPHSKLILKCGSFSQSMYQHIFYKHFLDQGIEKNRIEFCGWSDQKATLKKYHNIDIMLDNIPVNGGSTLFEALMQGVPAVTLMGDRWAARSGPSVLTTLKQPELIAKSIDDYVDIVSRLAKDIPALKEYRRTLREKMLKSSLTNIDNFYQNFEDAYLYMWNRWCNSSAVY